MRCMRCAGPTTIIDKQLALAPAMGPTVIVGRVTLHHCRPCSLTWPTVETRTRCFQALDHDGDHPLAARVRVFITDIEDDPSPMIPALDDKH